MKLLAVLLVALAAMDLSGTSANDRDRDEDCLCHFPDKMQGTGILSMRPKKYSRLAQHNKHILYMADSTRGRVAIWNAFSVPLRAENPDYIMDLEMDLLYKLERDPNVPCTKAKLPDEWILPNCFPSGMSLKTVYSSGAYLYKDQDYNRRYTMLQNHTYFTEKEPCVPSSLSDSKNVEDGQRIIFLTNGFDIKKNPETLALDLSNCTQEETLNFPFNRDKY